MEKRNFNKKDLDYFISNYKIWEDLKGREPDFWIKLKLYRSRRQMTQAYIFKQGPLGMGWSHVLVIQVNRYIQICDENNDDIMEKLYNSVLRQKCGPPLCGGRKVAVFIAPRKMDHLPTNRISNEYHIKPKASEYRNHILTFT